MAGNPENGRVFLNTKPHSMFQSILRRVWLTLRGEKKPVSLPPVSVIWMEATAWAVMNRGANRKLLATLMQKAMPILCGRELPARASTGRGRPRAATRWARPWRR